MDGNQEEISSLVYPLLIRFWDSLNIEAWIAYAV